MYNANKLHHQQYCQRKAILGLFAMAAGVRLTDVEWEGCDGQRGDGQLHRAADRDARVVALPVRLAQAAAGGSHIEQGREVTGVVDGQAHLTCQRP